MGFLCCFNLSDHLVSERPVSGHVIVIIRTVSLSRDFLLILLQSRACLLGGFTQISAGRSGERLALLCGGSRSTCVARASPPSLPHMENE